VKDIIAIGDIFVICIYLINYDISFFLLDYHKNLMLSYRWL
jgi:hypothetical protein